MNRYLPGSLNKLFLAAVLAALAVTSTMASAEMIPAEGTVEVYFSPKGGATDAVVRGIDGASKEILVQAYSFTSVPIAKALLRAWKRGVKVEIVLDKGKRGERYSEAKFLADAGMPTYLDGNHPIAHNKIMLIDGEIVITGSFNFTKQAEKNGENLLVIKNNHALMAKYRENYMVHRTHSMLYKSDF